MEKGKVIKSTGSWYQVELENGQTIQSRIVGKFRLDGKKLTNPVAVGDEVQLVMEEEEETGVIKNILPRKNYVVRQLVAWLPHRNRNLTYGSSTSSPVLRSVAMTSNTINS